MERQTVSSSPYFYRTQQKSLQKQAQQYVKMFALPGSFIFLSSRFPGLYIPACFRLLTYSAMAFKSRLHIYSDRIAEDLHFVPFSSVLTYRSLDKISYAYFKNNLSYLICYCKKIFCMCFQFSDFLPRLQNRLLFPTFYGKSSGRVFQKQRQQSLFQRDISLSQRQMRIPVSQIVMYMNMRNMFLQSIYPIFCWFR